MIYLDYSATTPVDERVLDSYCKTTREYIGNANSMHTLGVKSKELWLQATNQIATILGISPKEIILFLLGLCPALILENKRRSICAFLYVSESVIPFLSIIFTVSAIVLFI